MIPALQELQSLFGARDAGAYRPTWGANAWSLDWFLQAVPSSGIADACAEVLRRCKSSRIAFYDPLRPELVQRNRVVNSSELGRDATVEEPALCQALRLAGVADADQLRVLVCDGEALLAWVGFYRQEPFGERERALLSGLVPAFRTRLRFLREVRRAGVLEAGLEAALDGLGAPAFIVDGAGSVLHTNRLGAKSRELLTELRAREADGRTTSAFQIFKLRDTGAAEHRLVVASVRNAAFKPRLLAIAERWRLTPKQREVLGLLLRGMTNKQIAEELRCVESTTEIHVSAVLRKSGVDSRAAVLAKFWNEQ